MEFNKAREFVQANGVQMLSTPTLGLRAVAVGVKHRGSIFGQTDFAVTAYVDSKLTSNQLQASNIQPFDAAYAQMSGQPQPQATEIDVVECGSAFSVIQTAPALVVPTPLRGQYGGVAPTLDTQRRFGSLRVGLGITNPINEYPGGFSVGTAGFYMQDTKGVTYVVSNNHVIGRVNSATPGDAVVQPGTLDLTNGELNAAPTLADLLIQFKFGEMVGFVPLQFSTPQNTPHNQVDAAIARLTGERDERYLNCQAYGGAIAGVAAPYGVGADGAIVGSGRVYKIGRTTGYTEGEVIGIAGVAAINYGVGNAFFTDQIVVRGTTDNGGPFSKKGDSGSGILNERHELVGLLFAGSSVQTLINPIDAVLGEINNLVPGLAVVT